MNLLEFIAELEKRVDRITVKLEKILMVTGPDILALLTKIDDATTAVAARIQKLVDQLNAPGGITPEEAQQIADKLGAEVTKLESMGKDPENPV